MGSTREKKKIILSPLKNTLQETIHFIYIFEYCKKFNFFRNLPVWYEKYAGCRSVLVKSAYFSLKNHFQQFPQLSLSPSNNSRRAFKHIHGDSLLLLLSAYVLHSRREYRGDLK